MTAPRDDLTIVPANQASWGDLERLFDNVKRHGSLCFCQRFKIPDRLWRSIDSDERAFRLRAQTECDHPESDTTRGLVAYLDGEAVGWCAVEPRVDYPGLRTTRVVWAGRHEDKNDRRVWAITCLIVRMGHRRHGITYPLVAAAADYAKARGASAIEGYPMNTEAGRDITWGELHVGPHGAFVAAGFEPITHPTARRTVMRIDFA